MSNPISNSNPRKGKGRQKIEMKKITTEKNLEVTFSKRRSGLFKKANELSTLCAAKVGLVVFSPKGKAFPFGNPDIDTVIDRYLMRDPSQNIEILQFTEARPSAIVRELTSQISQINEEIDIQKLHCNDLKAKLKEAKEQVWWASPIKEMNVIQLDSYKLALESLNNTIIQGVSVDNPPHYLFSSGSSSSSSSSHNQPLLLPQSSCPHPPAQLFPICPPQMMQNSSMMLPNHMISDEATRMHHHA